MHDPISVIACVVGIIGCVIGVATFVSAQLTKARENGALMEKVDYLVRSFDEQKKEAKEHNQVFDKLLDEHTVAITDILARLKNVEKEVFHGRQ